MKFAILIFLVTCMTAAFAIQSRLPTARFITAEMIPPKEEWVSKLSMALQVAKYESDQLLKWTLKTTYVFFLVALAPINLVYPTDTRYKIIATIVGALIVNDGLEKLAYAIYTTRDNNKSSLPTLQSAMPVTPGSESNSPGTKKL